MNSVLAVGKSGWGARSKKAVQLLGGIFAVLLLCLPAFSQGSFGRILGTVTDQSGGVVAGATVTVIDTERGINRALTTDDAGAYNAPNLTAGNYTVRVEAKGFKRIERQGITIEVGHEVRVDLTVQPGEQNQTVTVTESVPLVETTNATQGGTLENADIIDLPLNGRDYQNLLGLRPGVMLQPGGGPWTQSTNGVRPDESVWLIEGIINANFFDARPVINMPSPFTDGATIMPVDAIQEFNLMENPKAEYGWKAGAIVNVGIKSGTNQLHGDAYAFGRYDAWDARNFFNPANPISGCALVTNGECNKTPAQLKQFGAVVGGPIKKDKLFFFGGYEGLRSFIGFVGQEGVPATASLGGDPVHSMVDAIQALQAASTPRSALSEKLAGCTEPTPTTATCTGGLFPNSGTSTNFLSTFPTTNTSDNGVGKLDYHPNDKNSFNGMFFYGHYNALGEDHPFAQVQSEDTTPIRSTSITASWVYTPNSNVVNEMRFGHDRVTFDFINVDVGVTANSYGINTGITNPLAGGLPSVTMAPFGLGGTPVLGTAFNRPQYFTPNPYYDFQDSVSILKGKHAIKVGGEYAHLEADSQVFNNGRGRLNFPSVEGFFQGVPSGTLLTGNPLSKLTAQNFAGYIQDDWRMTPKLIVNLGLRYTFLTPFKDANNNLGNFDPSSATGMVQQGQAGYSTIYKNDPFDFEPRIGLAWDMMGNGTTVMRIGVGLIHETWTLETFEGQFNMQGDGSTAINAIPTGASITCGLSLVSCPSSGGGSITLGSAGFIPSQLCWDPSVPTACLAGAAQGTVFPGSTSGPKCGDGVGTAPSPCDLMSVDPNLKLPYIVNYNVGVTHAFGSDLSLEVEYVGNHGYRLLNFADINQAQQGSAYCLNSQLTAAQKADACAGGPLLAGAGSGQAAQESRPFFSKFPYLGYIYQISNRSYSNYNSLQVSLTKRMTHGLSFNLGYTYGKGLDNGSLNRFGLNPENSNNLTQDYAASDFDVRHRLTATVTYNIPGIKGFGQLLEGWQINSIVTYATAQPWQTYDNTGDFSGTNELADRWNISGNPADFPSGKSSIPFCAPLTPGTAFAAGNVGCTVTGIYGAVTTPATAAQFNGCTSHSASSGAVGTPLAVGGCYVSANGNSYLTPPALGTFGDMGRNIFRDSGFKNWDMSIFKNFTFKERYGIQARWEVFNILNHPLAANPSGASSSVNANNQLGGNAFGAAGQTPDFAAGNPLIGSGSQRVMQVGLKLTF
jgi:Carboxypeptidase regulatory-like domain